MRFDSWLKENFLVDLKPSSNRRRLFRCQIISYIQISLVRDTLAWPARATNRSTMMGVTKALLHHKWIDRKRGDQSLPLRSSNIIGAYICSVDSDECLHSQPTRVIWIERTSFILLFLKLEQVQIVSHGCVNGSWLHHYKMFNFLRFHILYSILADIQLLESFSSSAHAWAVQLNLIGIKT